MEGRCLYKDRQTHTLGPINTELGVRTYGEGKKGAIEKLIMFRCAHLCLKIATQSLYLSLVPRFLF